MCLSKNIRYLRLKNNLSQEDLANKLGYKSFTTIQKWESGVSEPSIAVLKILSELFKVDMNSLATVDLTISTEAIKDDNYDYFTDKNVRNISQFLLENPEYIALFDSVTKIKKDDIDFVRQMLDRFKSDNN